MDFYYRLSLPSLLLNESHADVIWTQKTLAKKIKHLLTPLCLQTTLAWQRHCYLQRGGWCNPPLQILAKAQECWRGWEQHETFPFIYASWGWRQIICLPPPCVLFSWSAAIETARDNLENCRGVIPSSACLHVSLAIVTNPQASKHL